MGFLPKSSSSMVLEYADFSHHLKTKQKNPTKILFKYSFGFFCQYFLPKNLIRFFFSLEVLKRLVHVFLTGIMIPLALLRYRLGESRCLCGQSRKLCEFSAFLKTSLASCDIATNFAAVGGVSPVSALQPPFLCVCSL